MYLDGVTCKMKSQELSVKGQRGSVESLFRASLPRDTYFSIYINNESKRDLLVRLIINGIWLRSDVYLKARDFIDIDEYPDVFRSGRKFSSSLDKDVEIRVWRETKEQSDSKLDVVEGFKLYQEGVLRSGYIHHIDNTRNFIRDYMGDLEEGYLTFKFVVDNFHK